jgi:hypothetical protein
LASIGNCSRRSSGSAPRKQRASLPSAGERQDFL